MSAVIKSVIGLVIFGIVLGVLVVLPTITVDAEAVMSSSAWAYVRAALYFVPVHTVLTILGAILALGLWSIIVAVVKTLWDVLPFGS